MKKHTIQKENLLHVITNEEHLCDADYCEPIRKGGLCPKCPLDITKYRCNDKAKAKRQVAINIYVEEYGEAELFEILL